MHTVFPTQRPSRRLKARCARGCLHVYSGDQRVCRSSRYEFARPRHAQVEAIPEPHPLPRPRPRLRPRMRRCRPRSTCGPRWIIGVCRRAARVRGPPVRCSPRRRPSSTPWPRGSGAASVFSTEYLNWPPNQPPATRMCSFFSDLVEGLLRVWHLPGRRDALPDRVDRERAPSESRVQPVRCPIGRAVSSIIGSSGNRNRGLTEGEFLAIKEVLAKQWPVSGGFLWPKKDKWTDACWRWCRARACSTGTVS
jgi:hypothetical protein